MMGQKTYLVRMSLVVTLDFEYEPTEEALSLAIAENILDHPAISDKNALTLLENAIDEIEDVTK